MTQWKLKETHIAKHVENYKEKRMNIMKIIIRVFGRYKNIVGKDKVQLEITDGNTIRDVLDVFVKRYPAAEKDKSRILVIKDKMYNSHDSIVSDGDELTLSPPVVSGG